MSNFSQYFPVSGGSGAGSGIPINGYFPFTVSATGNPTGYDSTTGLYTHPDGTFWVRTGFTVLAPPSTYPSATGNTPIQNQIHNQTNTDRPVGAGSYLVRTTTAWTQEVGVRDYNDLLYTACQGSAPYAASNIFTYLFNATPTNPAYPYEWTGTQFSTLSETTTGILGGLAVTSTSIFAADATYSNVPASMNIFEYNKTTGVYTNNNINIYSDLIAGFSGGYIKAMEADASNIYVLFSQNAGGGQLLTYTHALVFVSAVQITSSNVFRDMTFLNSTDLAISTTGINLQVVNATTGADVTINQTTLTNLSTFGAGLTYFNSDGPSAERLAFGKSGQEFATSTFDLFNEEFGDATVRTDTDSAQPLFVRIG